MKTIYQFTLVIFFSIICSVASADRFSQQKQKVISIINESYNHTTVIINQFNNLIQKQRQAQKKLYQLRSLMAQDNTTYCFKSLLQTTQKNIKLMSDNKQQLIRKKQLFAKLRKTVYQSNDIFQLNKNIDSINRYNHQTNLLIKRTNKLDKLWTTGAKNSCFVYLRN